MMPGMAHVPRVYHPGHLGPGPLTLSGDAARRLATVMRIASGDELRLFAGDGREWSATVRSWVKGAVFVEIGKQARQEAPPGVVLEAWVGTIRANRFEMALEKCVEAGADIIRPVVCEFSQRGDDVSGAKAARWQRIVIEATEQSGRLFLPVVQSPATLTHAVEAFRGAVVVAEGEGKSPAEVGALVVGPEGGLSAGERGQLKRAGAIEMRLGPYVLRSETAAIAGTAVLRGL